MSLTTNDGLVKIGIPWGFNEWTDPDGYFSELIYANISIVDFIPMIPKLNTKVAEKIKNEKELASLFKNLYIPDYDSGCKYYNGLLMRLNLSYGCDHIKGVRLYLTDNTQISEVVTNTYTENLISSLANRAIEKLNPLKQAKDTLNAVFQTTGKTVYMPPDQFVSMITEGQSSTSKMLGTIESILSGMKIDFPVVWHNTDYARRVSFNVVLSSPYGHPEAVWVWIVRPLLYLILLGTPVNWYGPVGYPLYITVKSPGLMYMKMAAIESITIDRGGANTMFNINKQPLKVVLNITVRDLFSTLSIDPEEYIDAQDIVINGNTDYTSNINSMPTVAKLVKSFSPQKPKFRAFKSRPHMTHSEPKQPKPLTKVALETLDNTISTLQNEVALSNEATQDVLNSLSDIEDSLV